MPQKHSHRRSVLIIARLQRECIERNKIAQSVAEVPLHCAQINRRFRHDVTVIVLQCSLCSHDTALLMKILVPFDYASIALGVHGEVAT